jgi:Cu-Zn family superoxide dismutase
MKMTAKFTVVAAVAALLVGAGCSRQESSASATAPAPAGTPPTSAKADIAPTQGNKVHGTVRFVAEGGKVHVIADLTGLAPGEHGIHIHEKDDCSAPDGSSTGGHFNPTSQPHAGRDAGKRHLGDMGNITADKDGNAHLDYVDDKMSLDGPNAIVGRAVVVHAGKDDFTSQPAGNSGARIGCGPIRSVAAAP